MEYRHSLKVGKDITMIVIIMKWKTPATRVHNTYAWLGLQKFRSGLSILRLCSKDMRYFVHGCILLSKLCQKNQQRKKKIRIKIRSEYCLVFMLTILYLRDNLISALCFSALIWYLISWKVVSLTVHSHYAVLVHFVWPVSLQC